MTQSHDLKVLKKLMIARLHKRKGVVYMSKKNILKIIGIILLIVIAIFVIHTIRNYIIITDLQNKIAKYTSNTNYSIKSISTSKEGTKVIMEYYKKENKQAIFMERNINGETLKVSMYDNGERIDVFTESSEGKSCDINSKVSIMQINLYNFLENDNKWQTLFSSAIAVSYTHLTLPTNSRV